MFKRSRIFISAMLVAILFISTFILSNSSRACPVTPPPSTLLTLYLRSDLIVVAEIASEKDGEIIKDYDDYTNIEVKRNLKVLSALKGKPPAEFVYTKSEYRSKNKPETESVSDDAEFEYSPYGYKGYAELRQGKRYLFFFTKDSDTDEYELTDDASGAKGLGDYDLEVHKKRLKELQAIEKLKKNQLESLTKWLIRCVEEPSTRWDGVFDLQNSFAALENDEAESDEEESDEKADSKEEFRLDEDFYSRSSEIAKNLTDTQKNYLSSIAFSILQQNPSFIENNNFYYSVSGLVKRWDKARLAIYSFGMLQAVDSSDPEKTLAAMYYLSNILDDEKLTEIAGRFPASDLTENTEENSDEPNDAEPADETADVSTEDAPPNVEQIAETRIEIPETKTLPKTKKLTPAEIRKNLLQNFVDRYQYLVANGFQVEEAEETEETGEPEISEVSEN